MEGPTRRMTQGLSRAGFDIDLKDGQCGEGELAKILRLVGPQIEVKSDYKAAHTGNVFVEYQQPSGDSGIKATTAHWWAFRIVGAGVILIIETERLKDLCRKAWREGRRVRGGDMNRYHGILVPVSWLMSVPKQAAA